MTATAGRPRYDYDGDALWMLNGSSALKRRAPQTFAVTRDGSPQRRLNELECVGDWIYANVYETDIIVRIDKATGEVLGEIDLSSIPLSARRPGDLEVVLNGIAYVPETGVFLVTGKLWPNLVALRLDG